MTHRVTIGLPVHNCEDTIEGCIESILAQSVDCWSLLILDDGSSDRTLKICQRYDGACIELIHDGENLGLAARLNQITRMSESPFIARMDADDVMHPERLERQLDFLRANSGVDVVGTSMYSIDNANRVTGHRAYQLEGMTPRRLLSHAHLVHPSVMGRTEWFRRNPYDDSFRRAQDHELWVRTFNDSNIVNLDEPLMFVREAGTVTAAKYATSSRAVRTIIRMYGPELIGWPRTLEMLAESHTKDLAYRVAERFGMIDRLVHDRNQQLDPDQRQHAQRILDTIVSSDADQHFPESSQTQRRSTSCASSSS